jgi:hypothetical protein
MMESRKFILFGFLACLIGILAYVFVFADAPFVEQPVEVEVPVPATP